MWLSVFCASSSQCDGSVVAFPSHTRVSEFFCHQSLSFVDISAYFKAAQFGHEKKFYNPICIMETFEF